MNGHITLDRKILEWEWYDNINVCRLFIHLLLRVNWTDEKWHGMIIKRGQIVTSVPRLAKETGLSNKAVRNALDRLIETGEVGRQTTNKYSVITVNNYNLYQDKGSQRVDKGQTKGNQTGNQTGSQRATNEEYNKEINNISCPTKPDVKKDKAIDERKLYNFEKIYSAFPKKTGSKQDAITYYLGWISSRGRCMNGRYIKLTNEQMYAAVKKYVKQMEDEGRELKYYQGFDRFMNKTILDYVEEETNDTS